MATRRTVLPSLSPRHSSLPSALLLLPRLRFKCNVVEHPIKSAAVSINIKDPTNKREMRERQLRISLSFVLLLFPLLISFVFLLFLFSSLLFSSLLSPFFFFDHERYILFQNGPEITRVTKEGIERAVADIFLLGNSIELFGEQRTSFAKAVHMLFDIPVTRRKSRGYP